MVITSFSLVFSSVGRPAGRPGAYGPESRDQGRAPGRGYVPVVCRPGRDLWP